MPPTEGTRDAEAATTLGEIVRLFLKLGVIGFGGPAAHIAMMRHEVVTRRAWFSDAEFLEIVGATNLIPGPNSTELAIHIGQRRAGLRGLLMAGLCFIAPAVVIVGALAYVYVEFGSSVPLADLRYGVLPVVVAIVAHAVYGLARSTAKDPLAIVVAVASCVAYVFHVHELVVLVAAGLAMVAATFVPRRGSANASVGTLAPLLLASLLRAADRTPVTLQRLFFVFLEIGSVLYGSGYVLVAFLQRDLVDQRNWITSTELLDAVAVGQLTPGPLFSTATFVGYQVDGFAGAAVATAGIFLPSFVFVAMLGRIVVWTRRSRLATTFLRGVAIGSLGLMAGVLGDLVDAAISDVFTFGTAVAALVVLVSVRCNSAWLIGAGFLIGLVRATVI